MLNIRWWKSHQVARWAWRAHILSPFVSSHPCLAPLSHAPAMLSGTLCPCLVPLSCTYVLCTYTHVLCPLVHISCPCLGPPNHVWCNHAHVLYPFTFAPMPFALTPFHYLHLCTHVLCPMPFHPLHSCLSPFVPLHISCTPHTHVSHPLHPHAYVSSPSHPCLMSFVSSQHKWHRYYFFESQTTNDWFSTSHQNLYFYGHESWSGMRVQRLQGCQGHEGEKDAKLGFWVSTIY